MPMFVVDTNVAEDRLPTNFSLECAKLIAKILDKPIEKVVVSIHANQTMCFGGSTDLCAVSLLHSRGKISPEENRIYAKSICDFFENTLHVPKNRCYIQFSDQDPAMLGTRGSTLASFL